MLRLFPALALVLSLGLAGSGTVSAAPLITVETAPGDDAAIIDGVKRTHAPDPRTKLFEVTAETSGGITVLKGRTDSAEALSDLRAAYYEKYGVSLFVGVGIPIPLLDEELAHDVSIRNEQITTNILDFGEEERPIGQTNYAELRSGSIEVRGQRVRTAPVASLRKAREIAETLKGWIARGEFLLTEPVQPMPAHSTVKGLKADDE